MTQARAYKFISMVRDDTQKILDRLNSRVKPTDLVTYGLIPEFTGRLPIVAHFKDLTRKMLVRIMIEPQNSIYSQFQEIFRNEGVELVVEPKAFDQIAELAFEYQNGARSLRGIFEEMMTPILYVVPDNPDIEKVVVTSLFSEATLVRKAARRLIARHSGQPGVSSARPTSGTPNHSVLEPRACSRLKRSW